MDRHSVTPLPVFPEVTAVDPDPGHPTAFVCTCGSWSWPANSANPPQPLSPWAAGTKVSPGSLPAPPPQPGRFPLDIASEIENILSICKQNSEKCLPATYGEAAGQEACAGLRPPGGQGGRGGAERSCEGTRRPWALSGGRTGPPAPRGSSFPRGQRLPQEAAPPAPQMKWIQALLSGSCGGVGGKRCRPRSR